MTRLDPARRQGIIGMVAVSVGILALVGLLAVCGPGGDDRGLGRAQVAGHEECSDDDCGGYRQDYDQWNQDDRNRNRGRNRGAFSPGPFDRSPVEMHDVCVSLDCSGREKRRDDSSEPGPSDA